MASHKDDVDGAALMVSRLRAANARASHLEFIRRCWLKPQEPLVEGFHTRRICEAIDRAFERLRQGRSTCLMISVHPRAGKSDLVSRYAGPHFIGEFPGKEVLLASYSADVVEEFSVFSRNVVKSPYYGRLYPNVQVSEETNKKTEWAIVDKKGKPTGGAFRASGLLSGLNSKGYSLGVLDDYCASRASAESAAYRNTTWGAFTNDFMTRRAPVSITIILATQWHIDDINGRVKAQMAKDPAFPQFEVLSFPARAKDWKEQHPDDEQYPTEYLFEDRMGREWYESQYATLGPYSAAALMDCNPQPRTGGRLSIEGIEYLDEFPEEIDKPWARVWDLAHTAKQRGGDDPDWTSGTRLYFERRDGDPVPHLWIADVVRLREGALLRDAKIRETAVADGVYVRQALGYSMDAKDAYQYLVDALPEISWTPLLEIGDKATRATPLEPIFGAPVPHVHVKNGPWVDKWLDEVIRFDGMGKQHDDQVDNLSAGYMMFVGAGYIADARAGAALAARRSRY